ncbi:MAG: DUF975 family protein [Bacteroidales bacterium]|jgi:uncharacterized membrane protein|nr:DUF975 family protein [Bacteroidales bacterium]
MTTENKALMTQAREALQGKWGTAVIITLIYMLCVGAIQAIPGLGQIAALVLAGPLALGYMIFALLIARKQDADVNTLFSGFQNFGNAFVLYLLMMVFILLWTLLLIIPGIIAGFSYSMAYFILSENPDMKPMDAIDASKKMMYGYKMKLFFLYLRFLGWALLCILTFGIGFLWLAPYMQVSLALFYEDIKTKPIQPEIEQ